MPNDGKPITWRKPFGLLALIDAACLSVLKRNRRGTHYLTDEIGSLLAPGPELDELSKTATRGTLRPTSREQLQLYAACFAIRQGGVQYEQDMQVGTLC